MDHLTLPLAIAFLFFVGAMGGWVLEFFYRNLISHKGPRGKFFINPGFCKGPWLPIYGIGLSVMCVLSEVVYSYIDPAIANTVPATILIILIMGLTMNVIEFLGGVILLKFFNMRLWDYRDRPGNIMGVVCPLFALIWTGISAVYYLFIHEISLENLAWFSKNLAYAFFVGLFFGLFIVDMAGAFSDAKLIKRFANDREVIVKYEDLKALIQQRRLASNKKQSFFSQVISKGSELEANLEACLDAMEDKKESLKAKFGRVKHSR